MIGKRFCGYRVHHTNIVFHVQCNTSGKLSHQPWIRRSCDIGNVNKRCRKSVCRPGSIWKQKKYCLQSSFCMYLKICHHHLFNIYACTFNCSLFVYLRPFFHAAIGHLTGAKMIIHYIYYKFHVILTKFQVLNLALTKCCKIITHQTCIG